MAVPQPTRPSTRVPDGKTKPRNSELSIKSLPCSIKVEQTVNQPSIASPQATNDQQPSVGVPKPPKRGIGATASAMGPARVACPFDGCEVTFSAIRHRDRHVKSLHSDPRYQSQLCEKRFRRLDYWRSHFRKCCDYHCSPNPTPPTKAPTPPKYLRPPRTPAPTERQRTSPESPEVPLTEILRLKRVVIEDVNSFQRGVFGPGGLQFPLEPMKFVDNPFFSMPSSSQSTFIGSSSPIPRPERALNHPASSTASKHQASLFDFGFAPKQESTSEHVNSYS